MSAGGSTHLPELKKCRVLHCYVEQPSTELARLRMLRLGQGRWGLRRPWKKLCSFDLLEKKKEWK
ncbi:hypothetical protein GN244_ATG06989 [Phytophthora infestans]|uniref:Uncharacterized protein n=1 Tax=Phytophthora infestans TaxID=4787 RepID=A0A833THG9_PHYIN|nr:hypothetical protein GN244_ATG06989 [Phytophthora infestans]